jgi:hypothetical protein
MMVCLTVIASAQDKGDEAYDTVVDAAKGLFRPMIQPRPMPLMPVSDLTLGQGRPEINCTARSSLMWAMATRRSGGSALMSTQSASAVLARAMRETATAAGACV